MEKNIPDPDSGTVEVITEIRRQEVLLKTGALQNAVLPGISGIETLRLLREDPLTAHITVVAIGANAMPRDLEKGLQAGFFSYLTKGR